MPVRTENVSRRQYNSTCVEFIGWINLIVALVYVFIYAFGNYGMYHCSDKFVCSMNDHRTLGVLINIFEIIFNAVLIYGARKRLTNCFIPWILLHFTGLVCYLIIFIIILSISEFRYFVGLIISFPISLAMYCVVYKQYKNLKMENMNAVQYRQYHSQIPTADGNVEFIVQTEINRSTQNSTINENQTQFQHINESINFQENENNINQQSQDMNNDEPPEYNAVTQEANHLPSYNSVQNFQNHNPQSYGWKS